MGFISSMMDEAGRKTGKAITNKLFGSYADDMRLSYADRTERNNPKVNIEAIRLKAEEENNLQEQLRELHKIEFDLTDMKKNANILIQLSSIIDSEGETKLGIAARSKYEAGLALCREIAPSDPVVRMLIKKTKEREEKKRQEDKRDRTIIFVMISLILAFYIILFLVID